MPIPASKVRSVCTESEVKLVRASRRPELEQLSYAEVKRLAVRARAQFEKWQDLSRNQARARGREVGLGELDANTQLKMQIFRDAQAGFEARLAKLDVSAAPTKTAGPKGKKHRNAEHRATRAAVRKGMTAVEDLLNLKKPKAKKPAMNKPVAPPSSPQAVVAPPKPTKAASAARKPAKAAAPKSRPAKATGVESAKQLQAITTAKKSRVARSGKTTRLHAHIASRGKRNQARRDAKG